jgi:predicted nucleotidyltransferase
MLKKLQNLLKSRKPDSRIVDIILYGSFAKGETAPRDIDIAVIFREGSLKERLNAIQEIKKKIGKNIAIDIKGILLEELFEESFFARGGIFFEGISLLTGKSFSKRIGYESYGLFFYSLTNKSHNEKIRFNYLLRGRNSEGIIKHLEGKHLSPGVVQMPSKNVREFESVLKKNEITYQLRPALTQI